MQFRCLLSFLVFEFRVEVKSLSRVGTTIGLRKLSWRGLGLVFSLFVGCLSVCREVFYCKMSEFLRS